MRILNISQNFHIRGGSDRYFFALTNLLVRHGHEVIPFAAAHVRNEATMWRKYFPEAADFERPGAGDVGRFIYSREAAKNITRIIDEHRPDVAHLHIYYGKLTASILAPLKRAGIPIVQTLHEYKLICPVYTLVSGGQICEACHGHQFWQALPRRCNRGSLARTALSTVEAYVSRALGALREVDHFIAVSDFVREKMIEHGVPAERISTVLNFVEGDGSALTPPGDYFLYAGRVEAIKGVHTLIGAAGPVGLPLKIAGTGAAEQQVRDLIAQNGWDSIEMLGFLSSEELVRAIRGSLCTIVPSQWYEPLALAALESFAQGRAVIASEIGGLPEVVRHQQTGTLVAPGDQLALREAMLWMQQNPQAAAAFGEAGYLSLKVRHGPEQHYHQLMEIYSSLL
jgi:glycosyltransferase involved in cell wall biosynthesis